MLTHVEIVASRRGVLERMGRVGAEEAAAVGAQVLDRHDGRHRAAGNHLRLRLALGVLLDGASTSAVAVEASSARRPP